MYLYTFQLHYKDSRKETYFKFCRYPKRTKLYKSCIKLLDNKILDSFDYYANEYQYE